MQKARLRVLCVSSVGASFTQLVDKINATKNLPAIIEEQSRQMATLKESHKSPSCEAQRLNELQISFDSLNTEYEKLQKAAFDMQRLLKKNVQAQPYEAQRLIDLQIIFDALNKEHEKLKKAALDLQELNRKNSEAATKLIEAEQQQYDRKINHASGNSSKTLRSMDEEASQDEGRIEEIVSNLLETKFNRTFESTVTNSLSTALKSFQALIPIGTSVICSTPSTTTATTTTTVANTNVVPPVTTVQPIETSMASIQNAINESSLKKASTMESNGISVETTSQKLEMFTGCAAYVANVSKKAPNKFVFLCKNLEAQQAAANRLKAEFGNTINIEVPAETKYLLKIVGLPPVEPENAISTIKECNPELENAIPLHRSYYITNAGGQYLNLILEVSCRMQKIVIQRKKILLDLKSYRAFEYIDLLQCYYIEIDNLKHEVIELKERLALSSMIKNIIIYFGNRIVEKFQNTLITYFNGQ